MAQEAYDSGVKGAEVEAIIRLAAESDGDSGKSQKEDAPPPPTGEDSSLAEEEPWDGYSEEKASDITEAIQIALDDDDATAEDKAELLTHIIVYENANKGRRGILERATKEREAYESAEKPPAEEEGEGEAKDPETAEDGSEGEEGSEGGEGDGEEAGAGDDGESGHEDAEPEADGPDDEGRPGEDEGKPSAQDSDTYRRLIQDTKSEVDERRLHVPSPPTEEIEDLPFDLNTLSDKELRKQHGIYGSLAYHANYRLELQEAYERMCRAALNELKNYLLVASQKYDDHDKAKTMTIIEAEVNVDPAVKAWIGRVNKHTAFASVHRNERDSYQRLSENLSRQETMRDNEHNRAGGGRKR